MLPIQVRRVLRRDEELTAVGARAGVGHGKEARSRVLHLEVLVRKLLSVDGLAAGAVALCEVSALDHEILDDAMEYAPLVVQRLSPLPCPLLPRAQRPEVLRRLGRDVLVKLHHNPPRVLVSDFHIEEHVRVGPVGVGSQDALLLVVQGHLVQNTTECCLFFLFALGVFGLPIPQSLLDILVGVVDFVRGHEVGLGLLEHARVHPGDTASE
mmetsp:Transcript_23541/g.47740  ORF Transcript_23541/g.47740 Transcript_23541/m.47740 type:complete len:211 (-) Transcript_23541:702-1334(-)